MVETEFTEEEIDFAMETIRDLIPYNTPNYEQVVRDAAIGCLRSERDPDFIAMCEEHDRMLENGELDDDYYHIKRGVPNVLNDDLNFG